MLRRVERQAWQETGDLTPLCAGDLTPLCADPAVCREAVTPTPALSASRVTSSLLQALNCTERATTLSAVESSCTSQLFGEFTNTL